MCATQTPLETRTPILVPVPNQKGLFYNIEPFLTEGSQHLDFNETLMSKMAKIFKSAQRVTAFADISTLPDMTRVELQNLLYDLFTFEAILSKCTIVKT